MALQWNLSRIENNEKLCWERRTQADLDAEGEGQTLEGLVKRVTFSGSDWRFPERLSPLEQLAYSKETYVERMNPVTHVLIMATMTIDLRGITADGFLEFYIRIAALEKVQGAFLRYGDSPRYVTLDDVKAHIGLSCNVSDTSWFMFAQKLAQIAREMVVSAAGQKDKKPTPREMEPSLFAKECVELLETLSEASEEFGYVFEHGDSGSKKLERCQKRLIRIRGEMEDLVGELEEVEALAPKDDES